MSIVVIELHISKKLDKYHLIICREGSETGFNNSFFSLLDT